MTATGLPLRRIDRDLDRALKWFGSIGVDRFDTGIGSPRPEGSRAHSGFSITSDLDAAHFWAKVPELRKRNAEGCCIYFRPARHLSWPVVFLDDVPTCLATSAIASIAALAVETSAARCHLWLRIPRPLTEQERYAVQKQLAPKFQADLGSISGEHFGRPPGFRNQKPGRNCWVNVLGASAAMARCVEGWVLSPAPAPPTLPPYVVQDRNPVGPSFGSDATESGREWGWVMGSLESGKAPHVVYELLVERARERRGPDAERYARHTVRKACTALGIACGVLAQN